DPRDDVLRFLARLDEAREVVNVGLLIGAKSALGFLGRRCHLLIASNDRVDVVSVATSAATATTHGRWVAAIALADDGNSQARIGGVWTLLSALRVVERLGRLAQRFFRRLAFFCQPHVSVGVVALDRLQPLVLGFDLADLLCRVVGYELQPLA